MPLINYEINLMLIWPENCYISNAAGATKFAKLSFLVVT